jgi:hypothetical protein
MYRRLMVSLYAAVLAFCIAYRLGDPMWEEWNPGDAADIGLLTFALVYFLLRKDK